MLIISFIPVIFIHFINLIYAEKFNANLFYQDNICKDINFIIYSYDNFEECEVLDKDLCNGYITYSNKAYCGDNSLDHTKKTLNNKEFIYFDIYDNNCSERIGAVSYILNTCISFMDSYYFKIKNSENFFEFTNYIDPLCDEVMNDTDNININMNLNNCLDKVNIDTNNGRFISDPKRINKNDSNELNKKDVIIFNIIVLLLIILYDFFIN